MVPCAVPTRAHNPNSVSIGSAVFAGLTTVTDGPTDHATRFVRSTVMRTNNMRSRQFAIRPHRRRSRTVQSYSPDCASVHPVQYSLIGIRTIYRFCPLLSRFEYCQTCWGMSCVGPFSSLKIADSRVGIWNISIPDFFWPPSPHLERHLDRFSSFAGLTVVTDRPTDHASPSVAIGGSAAMRPGRDCHRHTQRSPTNRTTSCHALQYCTVAVLYNTTQRISSKPTKHNTY